MKRYYTEKKNNKNNKTLLCAFDFETVNNDCEDNK